MTQKEAEHRKHEEAEHKKHAGEKKPSMKRRCSMHDYRDRGIYMITMVTEGRRPLFGSLCGHPDEMEGEQRPHVVLTAMGEKVEQCWKEIARYHPAVEPMKLCIMPDLARAR